MAELSGEQQKAKEGIDDLMALMSEMETKVGNVAEKAMAEAQRNMQDDSGFADLPDEVMVGDDVLNNAMSQCEQFMVEHIDRHVGRRQRRPSWQREETEDSGYGGQTAEASGQPQVFMSRCLSAPKPVQKPRLELFDKCVSSKFEDFAIFLRLNPLEKKTLREQAGLPLPPVEEMSLDDVAAELATGKAEFNKHCHILSKRWFRTVPEVVKYLIDNSVLLTAAQAKQLFSVAYERVTSLATTATMEGRLSIRVQLVVALHCFCVQPYVLWEDDGDNQCTWANMTYNDALLWDTGLCEDMNGDVLGTAVTWGLVQEGSCRTGCGYWPNPGKNGYCSFCSVGKGPEYPNGKRPETVEEARSCMREDVSGLRAALQVCRPDDERDYFDRRPAWKVMTKPVFYKGGLHS